MRADTSRHIERIARIGWRHYPRTGLSIEQGFVPFRWRPRRCPVYFHLGKQRLLGIGRKIFFLFFDFTKFSFPSLRQNLDDKYVRLKDRFKRKFYRIAIVVIVSELSYSPLTYADTYTHALKRTFDSFIDRAYVTSIRCVKRAKIRNVRATFIVTPNA